MGPGGGVRGAGGGGGRHRTPERTGGAHTHVRELTLERRHQLLGGHIWSCCMAMQALP